MNNINQIRCNKQLHTVLLMCRLKIEYKTNITFKFFLLHKVKCRLVAT